MHKCIIIRITLLTTITSTCDFGLTGHYFHSYWMLGRIPKYELWEQLEQNFNMLDVLPITNQQLHSTTVLIPHMLQCRVISVY